MYNTLTELTDQHQFMYDVGYAYLLTPINL